MTDDGARITDVRGGATGVAATYAAVRALADRFDEAASEQRDWAADGARVLLDPDLLLSAPLAPITFAAAEAAVVAATTGPLGLVTGSCGWEADAVLVRAALEVLAASDTTARLAIEALDWQLGFTVGLGLRLAGPPTLAALAAMPSGTVGALAARAQSWAVGHPRAVEHLVNGGGGLLSALGPLPIPNNRAATSLLSLGFADGEPSTRRRDDLRTSSADRPPGSLADLVRHLAEVAALSPHPDSDDNGTLEVQTLGAGTDHVRHVVYLPGTDDLATLPWTQDDDVRDLGTDLRSLSGDSTAYQHGIVEALAKAGVRPGEPVLLVGHSLGGMEAVALASRDTGFTITDVVTAGSPTAQIGDFPDGVRVLSLEHRGDIVPLLDGAPNPDRTTQTTITFEHGDDATIVAVHGYDHYIAGAAAADASSDPAVAEHLATLHDRGFIGQPGQSTSQVFQVVRGR